MSVKTYFISNIPAYLKINGNYAGIIGKNPSFTEAAENSLFEFLPLDENFSPCYSEINGSFYVKSLNLCNGVALFPVFPRLKALPYKVIFQKNYNFSQIFLTVTVITDGTPKFFIDGAVKESGELPFIPYDADVNILSDAVIISFGGEKTAVYAYIPNERGATMIFKDVVNSAEISSGALITKKIKRTIIPVEITEIRRFGGESDPLRNVTLLKSVYAINEKLFTAAFMELIAVGADVKNYLSPTLKTKSDKLKEFIGNAVYVFPSPEKITDAVVVTDEKASVYSLTKENSLITNVIER